MVASPPPADALSASVALVTGGGRGIGRALALALARAGAAVAITARSGGELTRTLAELHSVHDRAAAVRADVTDRAAVDRAVAETEARLGPIDFLVNNAGSAGVIGPVWETDPDDWWREMEVNLRGPLLRARGRCCPAWSRGAAVASSTWPPAWA
jgi:NAD(P)-dependent dehydrogenase (short-subunit alcohol dehydrogenase family)